MTAKKKVLSTITGIVGFIISAACAYYQNWQPIGMIWAFWCSSLIVGCIWIIVACVVILFRENGKYFKKDISGALIIGGGIISIVVLAHWMISVFLGDFIPFIGAENTEHNFLQKVWVTLQSYFGMVTAVIVARLSEFPRGNLIASDGTISESETDDHDPLLAPFKNLLSMMLMAGILIVFGIFGLLGSSPRRDEFLTYAVLFLYFFPWGVLGLKFKLGRKK